MRRVAALVITLFTASTLFAVAPQFWRVRNAEDFLAGDIEGFAVTSRGELRPGPSLKKIATFTDPFVLSQVGAPNGDHFFGTGNEGKVYRLHGTELKAVYTAPEPEVYAVAFHDGAVYVGSSPNGKVYRVDPNDGKSTVFFDPKQAYIWAMEFLPNGDLAVATGVDGKLFRVTPKGEGKVLFDSPETHLRCLAVKKDGTLLAGGSAKGRIYEIRPDGGAHALYDSPLSEISSIYVDANGIGWASAASNILPSTAPVKATAPKPATQTTAPSASTTASSGEQKKEEPTGSVEVSIGIDDSAAGSAGSGEIYKINPDGFVELVRKFEHEMAYGITGGPNGSILLATGPQGRIYQLNDGEVSLVGSVPEKQVVSISTVAGQTLITTTNSGAVYRMESGPSAKAEFRSAAKDVERFSRFGHYRIEGDNLGDGHLAIAFRSGNTRTPDATWSPWSAASSTSDGPVDVPAGRYVQWKLTMPKPVANVSVDEVTVAFMNRNVAPVIDTVVVQDPAVVYITGSYPQSPQVVEATNPDEYGIFTSLDTPRDRNEQGKKVYRRGYRTVTWRAHDDNGDALRYTLSFRKVGSEKWLRLRENFEESSLNFDTSQLPDGNYELRLSVTDAQDNPEHGLTDVKEGIQIVVDNTPPAITATNEGDDVVIHVSDKRSPIGKVEYSADAEKWIRLTPVDGIGDSPNETYRIKRSAVAGKFVIVRAVDAFFNVGTESIALP
ncbi:MAG TPA: PQQ-binding-like beta-propeller repeat protein [Thermoanaerobaculia bacterium]|nr:PQQ-binding-like beta-propeller repeat protein [Thermoanaerobaculia bacterium]